jgi:RNA polymerase sigma-70 factor, ECF subfamily
MTAMHSRHNELLLNWCAQTNGGEAISKPEQAVFAGSPKGVATVDLADVYAYHRRRLVATASRILQDHADAEDAVHEALLSAFKFKDKFRGESGLSTWLTRITINCCLMQLRRKRRMLSRTTLIDARDADRLIDQLVDERPGVEDILLKYESSRYVRQNMERLRSKDRELIELRYFQGLTLSEIAVRRRATNAAVMSSLSRARKALRRTLQQNHHGSSTGRRAELEPNRLP